jgi:hypothetical protein
MIDEEKPPSKTILYSTTGRIPATDTFCRRLAKLWSDDRILVGVRFIRGVGYLRCPAILDSL